LDGKIDAGVSAAPNAADLVSGWLGDIKNLAQHLEITDHTAP
jgi:hypothetical protein